jgi:hypothetical protein
MNYSNHINSICETIISKNNNEEFYLNEKSIQMKLAFELWKKSNIEPQLEKCFDYNSKIKTYTDIFIITDDGQKIGIEIKFKTRKILDKIYVQQGAVTNGKLNSLKDIDRLSKLKKEDKINVGYFVFITNDYLYWKNPRKSKKTNSDMFGFEQGKKLKKIFPPPTWSSKTFSEQMDLCDIKTEKIDWIVDDEQNLDSFRYFIIEC